MMARIAWILGALLDLWVQVLWMKEPAFYTWHFAAVLVLGLALGGSFTDVWLNNRS